MALYHKWDDKNAFTFALQFFMLISDSLGGVTLNHVSLILVEKKHVIIIAIFLKISTIVRRAWHFLRNKKTLLLPAFFTYAYYMGRSVIIKL